MLYQLTIDDALTAARAVPSLCSRWTLDQWACRRHEVGYAVENAERAARKGRPSDRIVMLDLGEIVEFELDAARRWLAVS